MSSKDLVVSICADEFNDLTYGLDLTLIQDSCSVRNVLKARQIATLLIGDGGELKQELLPLFIEEMQKNLYSLAPNREIDAVRNEHILTVLQLLHSSKELVRIVRHLSRPVSNRLAEQIIRDTLVLPAWTVVTDAHVRRACLSAWFTYLRQNLGSCFATAPAILIQTEQPASFLHDLDEIMQTGSLKRTFEGVENSIPMSITWGNGDLRKAFIASRDHEVCDSKAWMSPGIIIALEAVGFFADDMTNDQKINHVKECLEKIFARIDKPGHFFYTNAEELLEHLLLFKYEITRKQVEDRRNKPKNMFQAAFLPHVPKTTKFPKTFSKTNIDTIALFERDFDTAKTAFKSLTENALLKSWEFTVASFSEVNLDFCRWNLYASLGVNYDEAGGIGHFLYNLISLKVDQANNILKQHQIEYDELLVQMHYLESRARAASTEKEIAWVKMEYQSRQTELYHIEQLRQAAHEKAMKIAGMHEFLMREYDELFPRYFQEIYDADLHEVDQGPFDDSPAGFRLLYKYGRANPSLWTRIYTLSEFVEALVSFFTITESDLRTMPQVKGVETDFSFLITQLVGHVRSDQFLESAFYRMAKAHGTLCPAHPLENLDKVEKKPWVYTSGGSMSVLVSAYFRRKERPTEVSRWVENETELLAFFIDSLKQLPANVTDLYTANPNRSMLIHSPTHAFLLKPGFFSEAWKSELYTYSWIKHTFIEPRLSFFSELSIEEDMARDIIQELLSVVPHDFRPRYKEVFQNLPYRLSIEEFRSYVVNSFYTDRGLKTMQGPVVGSDDIDGILYSCLPYTSKENVSRYLAEILKATTGSDAVENVIAEAINRLAHNNYISAKQVLDLVKTCASIVLRSNMVSVDLHKTFVDMLRDRNVLSPKPFIFADSNWIRDYFAFVLNPGTGELELWNVDFYGNKGKPIGHWKPWINGSRHDPQWGIYPKPHEYVR